MFCPSQETNFLILLSAQSFLQRRRALLHCRRNLRKWRAWSKKSPPASKDRLQKLLLRLLLILKLNLVLF